MNQGTRGKWAEGKFKDYTVERSEAEAGFAEHRYADARAGSLQAAPADFMCMLNGKHFTIEVKEVNHVRLLPHKNFSPDKVARCRKWALAGSIVRVLVNFEPLGVRGRGWRDARAWRVMDLSIFLDRSVGGSWDLSPYPLLTFDETMQTVFDN